MTVVWKPRCPRSSVLLCSVLFIHSSILSIWWKKRTQLSFIEYCENRLLGQSCRLQFSIRKRQSTDRLKSFFLNKLLAVPFNTNAGFQLYRKILPIWSKNCFFFCGWAFFFSSWCILETTSCIVFWKSVINWCTNCKLLAWILSFLSSSVSHTSLFRKKAWRGIQGAFTYLMGCSLTIIPLIASLPFDFNIPKKIYSVIDKGRKHSPWYLWRVRKVMKG